MDNVVTMSLEKYTELVTEVVTLRTKVNGLKQKAFIDLEDEVLSSRISALKTSEEVKAALEKSDKELLNSFSYNNSYHFERASKNACEVVSVEELKAELVTCIKRDLNERLEYLINAESTAGAQ